MGYWIFAGNTFSQIAVGNADVVWAIENGTTLKQRSLSDPSGWETITGPVNNVAYASIGCSQDGTVMLTDSNGVIYRYNPFNNTWITFNQYNFAQIFVGNAKYIWSLGFDGYAYQYTQEESFVQRSNTANAEGVLTTLSIGEDGEVVAVNSNHQLMRYITNNQFHLVPNLNANLVSVASAAYIIAADTDNKVQRYIGEGYWEQFDMVDRAGNPLPAGTISAISAGVDGTVFMLLNSPGVSGNLYVYIPYDLPKNA